MAASQNALHHATLLSNYAQDWRPPEEGYYLVPDLFPVVPVDKEFDDYARFNASTWRQTAKAAVAPGSDVPRVSWYRDADGSYRAVPYALEGVIDHKERDAADDVVQYEKRQMEVPLRTLANTLEVDGLTVALTTGNLGTSYETVAAGERFDALGLDSNPLMYIERKCRRIKRLTGHKVDFIGMDDLVWGAIKEHRTTQMLFPVHAYNGGMPGLQLVSVAMVEEKLSEVLEKGAIHVTSFRTENARPPVASGSEDLRSAIKGNLIIAYTGKNGSPMADWGAFKCFSWVGGKDPLTNADLLDGDPRATMGVYTYPKPELGQRGSTIPRVITNRVYKVTRTDSLWVAFDCVDTSDTSLYGTELT